MKPLKSLTNQPGRTAFHYVLPASLLACIVFFAISPWAFSHAYLLVCAVSFSFFFVLHIFRYIKFRICAREIRKTLVMSPAKTQPEHRHIFILPNYSEPRELLQETINQLVVHPFAKSHYILVLAMEASEVGSAEKADRLVDLFKQDFLDIYISIHPKDLPGEARGKASNVNYAARNAIPFLAKKYPSVEIQEYFITVMDSDAWIPPLYVSEIEAKLVTDDKLSTIYCPPIFFSRNASQVPAVVRLTDIMWSCMVMQNLQPNQDLMFPCSTYTLNASLAKQVGFWDTTFEAIGEDMHMFVF